MTFHRFSLDYRIRVVLMEPIPREYVWLSFYMHRRFRNRALSKELAKHILHVLKGEHHVHWSPGLTTFRQLARELNWTTRRSSPFFQDCRASNTTHLSSASLCHPLFLEILKYEKLKRCPHLVNYVNRNHQLDAVHLIRDHFAEKVKRSPNTQQRPAAYK